MEKITGCLSLIQREWNKVWREIDQKNFSKALDHQGINFKLADRKAILQKSLINEIEILQHEQQDKKSNLANRYQFDFTFKNREIFTHANSIVSDYVENAAGISSDEEEKIKNLLIDFVPKMLCIFDTTFDQDFREKIKNESSMDVDEKDLGAMDVDNVPDKDMPEAEVRPTKRSSNTLYANNNLYCFFRLYQMLYARLVRMQEISDELSDVRPRSEVNNPVAVELGLRKESSISTFNPSCSFLRKRSFY
jgi:paired amphipathic helix protein Sin3a